MTTPSRADRAWEFVDAVPPLEVGSVHVWHAPLVDGTGLKWLSAIPLSTRDSERAERFRVPDRRHAFATGRRLARFVAARYLDRPVESVELDVHENGKPFVVLLPDEPALEISLTHSGHVLLVALSRAGVIGVDAERLDPAVDHEVIARRFFAPEEIVALNSYAPDQREAAFFRCWTRKEALVKALGEGLARSLSSFAVPTDDVPQASLVRVPAHWEGEDAWQLHDVAPGAGYAGALAVRGSTVTVRRLAFL